MSLTLKGYLFVVSQASALAAPGPVESLIHEPCRELVGLIADTGPVRDRHSIMIRLEIPRKWPDPALIALGHMKIGKKRHLSARQWQGGGTIAVQEVQRGGQRGSIRAAGAFDQQRARRVFIGLEEIDQHLSFWKPSRVQRSVEKTDPQGLAGGSFREIPARLRVLSAQIDDRGDTVGREQWRDM